MGEYEQEVIDKEALEQYMKPSFKSNEAQDKKTKQDGFKVKDAPWHGASDDAFPTLGGGPQGAPAVTPAPVWGPRR